MCLSPYYVPDLDTSLPCRRCNQCLSGRIDYLAAVAVMEALHSTASYAVTLTFSPEHEDKAHTLRPKDFKRFIERLRHHGEQEGYTVRYQAAGEYGKLRGRAHWHAILFFKGNAPDLPIETRFQWQFWPYGHTYIERASARAARYVCKYIQKWDNQTQHKKPIYLQSRYPALGSEYTNRLARYIAQQGLAPASRIYKLPEDTFHRGKPISFTMPQHAWTRFLGQWTEHWADIHGDKPIPETNEYVTKYLDQLARDAKRNADSMRALILRLSSRDKHWHPNHLASLKTFTVAPDGTILGENVDGEHIARLYSQTGNIIAEHLFSSPEAYERATREGVSFRPEEVFHGNGVPPKGRPAREVSTENSG